MRPIRDRKAVVRSRSRSTLLLTIYFLVALIIPNCVLANTEHYSVWTVEALILMPLGFYMMWSVLLRRSGIMIWLGFPFIFFGAFQLALLYLFGNSIIATDMFTNVLTTNPGEAGELLGNIYPAVIVICVIYVPLVRVARNRTPPLHLAYGAHEPRIPGCDPLLARVAVAVARLAHDGRPAHTARQDLSDQRHV